MLYLCDKEDKKYHWYLISYSYRNNVVSGNGTFYRFVEEKFDFINKSVIADFEKSARKINKEHDNSSLNLFVLSISYLGIMTKEKFEDVTC